MSLRNHFFLKMQSETLLLQNILHPLINFPTGTQRPENVPQWVYFCQDISNHKKTKIRRIRFLIYFSNIICDLQLESQRIEKKNPHKTILCSDSIDVPSTS